MAKRNIVNIDEEKCNGCGLCISSCAEGAIQLIDGKAKLVSDTYCDGLGACLAECPQDAITIEEREAVEFDEEKAMEHVAKLKADEPKKEDKLPCGCPGSMAKTIERFHDAPKPTAQVAEISGELTSELVNWPVQMKLVAPNAPYFAGADILLVADCVPFAYADFHRKFLKGGKPVVIGCPKLDDAESYVGKLAQILQSSEPRSLKVLRMEVPCCGGLSKIARLAIEEAGTNTPYGEVTIGINGEILA